MTTVYTWNVNGLRAAVKNGFSDWFAATQPDILCLQETRVLPEEVPQSVSAPEGYHCIWNPAEKRGYSGTAIFSRLAPVSVETLGIPAFDSEGRVQMVDFGAFVVINGYWPNSQEERKRLSYKLDFCKAITRASQQRVAQGKHVVLCGDYNIAHQEIDLARPKQNENNAGYYMEEREAMSAFLAAGHVDVFRRLYPETVAYTWWSYRARAREKNIGWRLDYHCVNEAFFNQVEDMVICDDVLGSDHCPAALMLKDGKRGKGKGK